MAIWGIIFGILFCIFNKPAAELTVDFQKNFFHLTYSVLVIRAAFYLLSIGIFTLCILEVFGILP
jgi:hypothetical protein